MTGLWVGKKVRLRPPRPEDSALLAQTADDTERDRLSWEVQFPFSPDRHRRRVEKAIEADEDPGDNRLLMIETLAGELVGSVNIHGSHPRHRTAEIGLGLRSRAYEGKGYASEATRLLLRFLFRELDYAKINLEVYEFNPRAIALYEHLGFRHEGRVRSLIVSNGQRWDSLMMGLTRADYELLHPAWFPDEAVPSESAL
jgi:RimJ/RimL family protein N-acetyltransferase